MTILKAFLLTTIFASLSCTNLCAMGAGPSERSLRMQDVDPSTYLNYQPVAATPAATATPQPAKPLITGKSSLKEMSALPFAQKIFDGAPDAPMIADLEDANITPAPIAKAIFQKLYQLCERTLSKDWLNLDFLKDKTFLTKPEWLRLWFTRQYYVKTGKDIGSEVGITDMGTFPVTDLLEQPWFPKPENGNWYLDARKINDFTGFEWIGKAALASTHELTLGSNQLTTLPSEIEQLTNLKILMAYSNKLSSLPETIGQLINLENLNLADNNLKKLPESIGNLKKLITLGL